MLKKYIILGLLVCGQLTMTGCSNLSSSGDSKENDSTSDKMDNEEIEGGSNSRVVGQYEFDTFEKYQEFYTSFKENNIERFLAPTSSIEFPMTYIFKVEGIRLNDYDSRRYDLDFELFSFYFKIDVDFNDIKFELFDLNALNLNLLDGEIAYKIIYYGRSFYIEYSIGETAFAKSGLLFPEDVNNDSLMEALDKVTDLLKEGIVYAY